jgi:phage tail-like protein
VADTQLATTFRFQVTLTGSPGSGASGPLGTGGFQECTGLEVEMDVSEYPEGGSNNAVVQRAGRAKYSKLVLKRGMFAPVGGQVDSLLWQWLQDVVSGVRPIRRYDGTVQVLGPGQHPVPVATWTFTRALPAKLVGPQLNAKTGDVVIEEMHLAPEELRLGGP